MAAIKGVLRNRYSVVIGPAGSGKTTIEKEIVAQLRKTLNVIDLRQAKVVTDSEGLVGGGRVRASELSEARRRIWALALPERLIPGRKSANAPCFVRRIA